MTGPREGIYLAAALAVVEQQVNERLDGVVARRRRATRALLVGLLVTTLAGGAATAAALTVIPEPTTPTVMIESSLELHCIDGDSTAAPALFTARISVRTEAGSPLDLAGICSTARAALVADHADALQTATPDDLLDAASAIVTTSTEKSSSELVDVVEASFGSAQPTAGPTDVATCERSRDGRLVVLMTVHNTIANTLAAQSARCLANDGYELFEEDQ
jgi:hypothetical protein